jgi:DNA-binding CsgD family transcriptional regulator
MPRASATGASLEFLEAAYAWEVTDDRWLRRLVSATVRLWGAARWACAYEYDVSQVGRFEMGVAYFAGVTGTLKRLLRDRLVGNGPLMAGAYRTMSLGYAGPLGGLDSSDARLLARAQTLEFFGINGQDGTGRGCFIGLGTERTVLTSKEMVLFQRLAAHLASAYRCRRRLRAAQGDPLDDSEAVLAADGRLLEARAEAAEPAAREALGRAGRSLARIRKRGSTAEPTSHWQPRIRTRWTLVDRYTRRGGRFLVARENQTDLPTLHTLTEREQQVVASALTGKSNKEIAYELGISDSTTRVLLGRAYARLGVRSRKELFDLPQLRALRGGDPGT